MIKITLFIVWISKILFYMFLYSSIITSMYHLWRVLLNMAPLQGQNAGGSGGLDILDAAPIPSHQKYQLAHHCRLWSPKIITNHQSYPAFEMFLAGKIIKNHPSFGEKWWKMYRHLVMPALHSTHSQVHLGMRFLKYDAAWFDQCRKNHPILQL